MKNSAATKTSISAIAIALGVSLGACGHNSTPMGSASPTATESESPTPPAGIHGDLGKITSVNSAMSVTSFHSSGSTTALGGGRMELWSDPRKGVHTTVVSDKTGAVGEGFCRNGVSYTSGPLLIESLQQAGKIGRDRKLPPQLADKYVSSNMGGQDCSALYKIDEQATLDPTADTTVEGKKTIAIRSASGATEDVYQVAVEGDPYILQMKSTRDGRTSTTTYDSFGEKVDIKLPPIEQVISMEQFREQLIP